MEHLGPIDIAFLPKNLPYTMSDQMFTEAARLIRPAVLYPYHYFEVDRPPCKRPCLTLKYGDNGLPKHKPYATGRRETILTTP